jgi:predicted ATPase
MIVSHLRVKNWRNFQRVSVALRERQFIVGANASGKSNLLDVFRFLRDIAKEEDSKRLSKIGEVCRRFVA